ncbi:MAG: MFS transporter [Dehalococcoidia bacterium]
MSVRSDFGNLAKQRLFPALGYRDFRMLWLALTSADSAAWAVITARAWLTFNLADTNRSTWVGIVVFAAMIPFVLVPILAGFLADRMVRRDLLAWVLAFQVVLNLIVGGLVLTDAIQIWHLIVVALATGSAMAAQISAAEPLTANLVPRKHLVNAYALVNSIFHGTRLLGPGIIAPLMGIMNTGWVFVLCAGAYILALMLVTRIHTRSTGVVESTKGVLRNLFSGFIYAYRDPVIFRVIALVIFHCSLTMSFESLLPAISANRLDAGGGGVAYMNMTVGLGALAIALIVASIAAPRIRGRLLLATGVVSGLTPLALATAPTLPLAMLATMAMGASQAGFMILTAIVIQSVVPDSIRGRVSSIYIMHAAGIMSFANFANGRFGDMFAPSWVLAIAGLAFLVVVVASALESTMRRMYVAGVPVRAAAPSS